MAPTDGGDEMPLLLVILNLTQACCASIWFLDEQLDHWLATALATGGSAGALYEHTQCQRFQHQREIARLPPTANDTAIALGRTNSV